jgi:hypothetical protein
MERPIDVCTTINAQHSVKEPRRRATHSEGERVFYWPAATATDRGIEIRSAAFLVGMEAMQILQLGPRLWRKGGFDVECR